MTNSQFSPPMCSVRTHSLLPCPLPLEMLLDQPDDLLHILHHGPRGLQLRGQAPVLQAGGQRAVLKARLQAEQLETSWQRFNLRSLSFQEREEKSYTPELHFLKKVHQDTMKFHLCNCPP